MAPFEFFQIWPKSVSLMLVQVTGFIWPPTRHLKGKILKKLKKGLKPSLSTPQFSSGSQKPTKA